MVLMSAPGSSVVVLLGAGASKDAGLPLALELTGELARYLQERGDSSALDALNLIIGGLSFQGKVYGEGRAPQHDIETVLRVAQQLARRNEQPLATYVGSWHPALERLAPNGEGVVFDSLTDIAEEVIHECLRAPEAKSKFKYLEELWEIGFDIDERNPPKVFTLNYDLLLEMALEHHDRGFTTGFNDGVWSNIEFDDPARMRIYKLHGSFGWFRHEQTGVLYDRDKALDRLDITFESAGTRDEVIFATDNKLRALQPFLWMFNEFDNSVANCSFIVSVGYGFNDEHINQIISNGMSVDESRHLIVVGPGVTESMLDRAPGFSIKPQRTHFIPKGAKETLQGDLVRKKLAEITRQISADDPFAEHPPVGI
ncbi:MAG: SIR2 family protein [Fimbriimonadaceae bacterium]|nr:SIR2 family protein [Fimbriimonadaceae bacterium]